MESNDRNKGIREGDVDERGEFREHGHGQEGVNQEVGSDLDDRDEIRVQRQEEALRAGVREREAGQVNVRKSVRTERERIAVPKKREEVSVERVPVNDGTPGEIGEGEVLVPVVEEEVVVEKRAVVKEEIRVKKDVVQDEEIVEADVRKEEVDIDDTSGTIRDR